MASISLTRRAKVSWLFPGVVFALATMFVSCSPEKRENPAEAQQQSANDTVQTNLVESPLTPDEKAAEKMRELLDSGDMTAAMRAARNLMDSDNPSVRSQVIDTFSWIGRRALPEITEMINDKVPEVSTEAISAWEQAFSEINGEHRQAAMIADTVSKLRDPAAVNAILMHATELEERISLPKLSEIIDANSTNFIGECARSMYTHISGGEIYESREATRRFLEDGGESTTSKQEKTNEQSK